MKHKNRQIPKDLQQEKVLKCISKIEDILGSTWLNNNTSVSNIIKSLWKRTDFLSTIELYTLGNALEIISDDKNNDEWILDFIKQVKSKKISNSVGVFFEAIAFSMFTKHHNAFLSKPGKPGVDFTVYFEEREVNFSCKSLQISDEEKRFKKEFHHINKIFTSSLMRNGVTGKHLFIYSHEVTELISRNNIKKYINDIVENNISYKKIEGFDFFLKDVHSDVAGFSLSKENLTYGVSLVSKFGCGEQKRFENLFRNATKNISKHSISEKSKSINAIIIKIPSSVSIRSARKWTINRFKRDGSKVTLAIIIRNIPTTNNLSTQNTTEVSFIINEKAHSSLLDLIKYKEGEMFKLNLPVGSISMEETKYILESEIGSLDLTDCYVCQKAHMFYETTIVGDYVDFNVNAKPDTSYSIIAKSPKTNTTKVYELVRPPENSFLII